MGADRDSKRDRKRDGEGGKEVESVSWMKTGWFSIGSTLNEAASLGFCSPTCSDFYLLFSRGRGMYLFPRCNTSVFLFVPCRVVVDMVSTKLFHSHCVNVVTRLLHS